MAAQHASGARPEVLIIGAGVAGLSCASELAAAGLRVQIWTAAMPEHTTSSVAAAFWYPYRVQPLDRVIPWAQVSYERFACMADEPDAERETGVIMREALELFPEPVADPPWSRFVDHFRHAWLHELPPGYGHGLVFTAPVIDMSRYLPWLRRQVEDAGVEILLRPLCGLNQLPGGGSGGSGGSGESLDAAFAAAAVVVNTSGLGARELVDDPRVYPIRGQIELRERGSLDRVIIDEHGPHITYIVPRGDDVVLGGISQERVTDLEADPRQREEILARCVALEPRLKDAAALATRVGLRPCRDEVRLEQTRTPGGGALIHNYGHGGAGVTLSWGCAREVGVRVRAALAELR